MDNQGMGTHSEPFFELLQPTTPPITTGSSSSSYVQNGPRRADSSTFTFNNDDVLPNYDFQPLRTSNGSTSGARIEEAGSSKYRHSPPSYEVRDPPVTYEKYESTRPRHEFDKDAYDSATAATVERIMKKYADNLLRVLEGIGGRLSQLEATTQRLEHSFEKVKASTANNHGEVDGRLRMLENMVREVQRGVQVIRDKQEIYEAHVQLKLQQEKSDVPTTKTEVQPPQPPASAPQQPAVVQQQPSVTIPQQPVQQPPQVLPPPPPQQAQTADVPQHVPVPVPVPVVQQHHVPPHPVHSAHPPPQQAVPVPQQQPTSYSYPPQSPVQAPPPPAPHHQQPPYGHQPEAPPYPQPPHHAQGPPPPPPHHQAPHHQAQGYGVDLNSAYSPSFGPPPPPHRPHQHGPPPPMYEPPLQGRTGSGPLALPPPPYAQQQQPPFETGYGGSSAGNYRLPSSGGSGGYPHLPTAQPIQQGRPPSRSGVDDVIDKVAAMGFPREQVRATVQRLTENGQPVDMNVVLDKLMNGAPEPGPPKGWFGR